jgi:hypothetical protein
VVGLFQQLGRINLPLWLVLAIVLVVVVVVLASVLIGYRMGRGMVATGERSSNVGQIRENPVDLGDYIKDAIMTPESIQRDREGRRTFSTTKED